MITKRQTPQPALQVPVPNFPFSSPITEEIASPSCSSAEGHDEQNRPFAFLSKATRQKIEVQTAQRESRMPATTRDASRLNIRGITKKRKSVAKPVGLNLVTDFTLPPAAAAQKHMVAEIEPAAAPFVDLNDLKLLCKRREQERTGQRSKDTFKKRISRGFKRVPKETDQRQDGIGNGNPYLNPGAQDPFNDIHEQAFSPSDRNVMIGLAVPSDESIERFREADSSGTPLTPSIFVTSANEEATWNLYSNTSSEMLRPRVASSVYSQPTPRVSQFDADVPPVPTIPAQHSGTQNNDKQLGVVTRNQRALSVDTWEDISLPPTPNKTGQTLTVNTSLEPDRPQSQGWWTYLLSPILSRSVKSPLSPSFPRDSPSTPSTSTTPARIAPKEWWDKKKEVSCFSPDTPATIAPIGERGRTSEWRDREKEISCFSPDTPETTAPMDEKAFEITQSMEAEKHQKVDTLERERSPPPAYVSNTSSRQNIMSFMFSNGQTIQGEAAEYYQACAHELFSKTPYFPCLNHVCSITPVNVTIPAGADGNRRLAFAGVDASHLYDGLSSLEETSGNYMPVANSTTTTKDAGLLIDVDSPRPISVTPTMAPSAHAVHAKEAQVQSPASATSVDSWDASITSDDEKDHVPPPISRKAPPQRSSQPVVAAPVPVPIEPTEGELPAQPTPAPVPAAIPMPGPAQVAPQIVTNVHYPSPPPQQVQQQPMVVSHYVPFFPPNQPGQPTGPLVPEAVPQEQQGPQEQSRGISDEPLTQEAPLMSSGSEWPWGKRGQAGKTPPQPQRQTSIPQEQFNGFEWAYDQQETSHSAPGTQASPQTSQVPPASDEKPAPQQLRRASTQRPNHLQRPVVVQGRQSGSGWPFVKKAHPHSNAPPVPAMPQTLPNEPALQRQVQQSEQSVDQDQPIVSDVPHGERGLPDGSELVPPQAHLPKSEPISPGFQRAAGGPGSIPMDYMPAPAPAYTQLPKIASIPPQYGLHPPYQPTYVENATIVNPGGAIGPHEARRRRLEEEDKIGRKTCGLLSLFNKKNGRPGREGRTRRRWYFLIFIFFFAIVIIAIVLAVTLSRKGASSIVQSQWLNLTGYPPMPTGIATLAGTEAQVEKSTCITPSSMWSCALPKAQQDSNEPYDANQPNFRVFIGFRNGTYDNSTDLSNSTHSLRRRDDQFASSPAAPSNADQSFLGQYTDNNTIPYSGEETPFYMSMLSPVSLLSTDIYRRSVKSNETYFPNISSIIPAPDENSDGSAAAAMLYPLPSAQPVRLYNRGQSSEHYGFYTYFDKSIFLTSQTTIEVGDTNGGTTRDKAKYRCTWSQTRFLVQIWTQGSKMNRQLFPYSNITATSTSSAATPTSTSSNSTSSSSATDFSRPGSFPYPVTITVDRHGGAEKKKMVYCYPVEGDGHYNITGGQLQIEDRGVGGELVNPAEGLFKGVSGITNTTTEDYGGVDGGTGGCGCQWVNWISTL
jgi:hypothetical protein